MVNELEQQIEAVVEDVCTSACKDSVFRAGGVSSSQLVAILGGRDAMMTAANRTPSLEACNRVPTSWYRFKKNHAAISFPRSGSNPSDVICHMTHTDAFARMADFAHSCHIEKRQRWWTPEEDMRVNSTRRLHRSIPRPLALARVMKHPHPLRIRINIIQLSSVARSHPEPAVVSNDESVVVGGRWSVTIPEQNELDNG